ncbi:MAG TPA: adenine deaminase [Bacteroidales bacterium]|nr:adenine deaminase [Bacteroidales bacterium]HNR41305.1 adenine deaminase [Bacteroidales bacterium]
MKISGKLIDIHSREIYPAELILKNGRIMTVTRKDDCGERYICPGFVDAHVHVESSMVTPGSFASAAVSRGTIGVVSDPHEIANVLGIEGVKFMIDDSKKVPLKFFFGAPSCVPATSFETAGAVIDSSDVDRLLALPEIKYLSEMMNFPGVINDDPVVREKLNSAGKYNKPVDGHAPALTGDGLRKYAAAGITTDHECTSLNEALEKISLGMKILIREGSAARNLNALKPLLKSHPDKVMLCSDDIHPEMLAERHINKIVSQLLSDGYDLFDTIRSCTVNPAIHYNLDTGLLRPGDPADFLILENLASMDVKETWIDGNKVFDSGKVNFTYNGAAKRNKFNCSPISKDMIKTSGIGEKIRVIQAFDGELFTRELIVNNTHAGFSGYDLQNDILKLIVKDRYNDLPPAIGFIRGFGLQKGAFAGSVAHDSHNIICAGTNDEDIVTAVNEIIRMKGGLAVADSGSVSSFQLQIAGIMTDRPLTEVASGYKQLSAKVKSLGCDMSSPFMTLSFMALLVIPELKLSDRGLFDGRNFGFVTLSAGR